MINRIRYQTGEVNEVIKEMKKDKIPCMDVDDHDDLDMFIGILKNKGIHKVDGAPYDKNARDKIKEPEFEFRVSFQDEDSKFRYIDFYFEPFEEETYASVYGD